MSITTRRLPRLVILAAAASAALLTPAFLSGQGGQKESFTGFAINMNSGPRTATVDIAIERWSTDAERNALLAIVKEYKDPYKANEKLLEALQDMPSAGYIRTTETLAWDLRYAHQNALAEGGRRIVVATDRPIGFREAANQTRTMDYPFTIAEFRLDKSDRGSGKILAGTRLLIENNTLVLENYGQQPVRFNEIRKQK
jgi:hypothetical protein